MKPVTRVSLQVAIKIISMTEIKAVYVIRNLQRERERQAHILARLAHPDIQCIYEPVQVINITCKLAFLSLHSFLSFILSLILVFLLFVLSLILLIRPLFLHLFSSSSYLSLFHSLFLKSFISTFLRFISLPSYFPPFFLFRF